MDALQRVPLFLIESLDEDAEVVVVPVEPGLAFHLVELKITLKVFVILRRKITFDWGL